MNAKTVRGGRLDGNATKQFRRTARRRVPCLSRDHARPCQAVLQADAQEAKPSYTDANFPVDPEGRTYHLGTRKGEVANRILSVGSTARAQLIATLLDEPQFSRLSSRGFLTVTGCYRGVPVSIISTHMGMPNMDFVVRESRAVVDGQMAVVRLGTCGAVQPPAKLGDLLIASMGSIAIRRDPDAWGPEASGARYATSRAVLPDPGLASVLIEEAAGEVGADRVLEGLNASADSFYSSQGRLGGDFDDGNEALISSLCEQYPALISLEMETFHLYDLARCAKGNGILAVGMCIALAERYSNQFMTNSALQAAEMAGGRASLAALKRMTLQGDASTDSPTPGVEYIWKQ